MEFITNLNLIDIAIIVLCLILSLFGAVKGLFKNIVLLILMIFSVILAGILAAQIQVGYLNALITDPETAYVVSFILVLVCAYLIIFGIMKVFMKNNKETERLSNTIFAFFIALTRFLFLFAIICSSINSFDIVKDNSLWEKSELRPTLVMVGDYAFNTKVKLQESHIQDYVPKEITGA